MEFEVGRRIGWEFEPGALRGHLDSVCDELEAREDTIEFRVGCDLITERVELDMVVLGKSPQDALARARSDLGAAIRQAGAKHEGLLEWTDEAKVRPHANAWSGLRTPQWTRRKVEVKV
ncbi:MAG: hypothetical protein HKN91_16695 [Acidimicrobiia bacterium]|nr:hypothetical protein [Acidimicrobiia bacterium]